MSEKDAEIIGLREENKRLQAEVEKLTELLCYQCFRYEEYNDDRHMEQGFPWGLEEVHKWWKYNQEAYYKRPTGAKELARVCRKHTLHGFA